jgi:hypothetical protein
VEFGELPGGLDAVYHRHVEVEENRVGLVLGNEVDGLPAVGGGGDDLDVGEKPEQ